ncbi:hypothetical protein C1646_758624 [Rhizophagus diaphanus]|nr:hypothetical protein C1646_758624 [Rhizophagus diaphanus] [Rhizophagus sp. MUCL 43196]
MTAILQQSLSGKQPIHFMPTEVSDDTKYINRISTYILQVSGCLINGQKAVVNITVRILSNILNSTLKFGIETISAYPLQRYHAEKKPYIRVRTWNHYDRYNALKAVRCNP